MKKNRNGFTLVEILVVLCIIAVLGISIGLSTNKLSENTRNSNNEQILKAVLSGAKVYCQLLSHKSECTNNHTIKISELIEAGVLDKNVLNKVNPAMADETTKFKADDVVTVKIVNDEKDFQYTCKDASNASKDYKLSTIDGCSKKDNCKWRVCK